MPFPTKIAAAVLGVGIAGAVGLAVLGGGDDAPITDVASAEEGSGGVEGDVPDALLNFTRPDGSVLRVMGPVCYEDTRGNDVAIFPSDSTQTDCFVLRNGGRDLLDLGRRTAENPAYIRLIGQNESYQSVALGAGKNVIEAAGGMNFRISGPIGHDNVLVLANLTTVDIRFRQQGDDVLVETPRGTIVLARQMVGSGDGPIAQMVLRGGVVLERSQIRVQSVVGQGTPGNDTIRDTDSDDVIYPGLGDDTITLLGGNNRVHYEGGNDRINSAGDRESHNTLYIPFLRTEVVVRPSPDGRDVLVETPAGVVRLELQNFYEVGDPRAPIQSLVFNDGPLDEGGIMALSSSFQGNADTAESIERSRVRN